MSSTNRITIAIAQEVASKLTESKKKKLDELKEELKKELTDYVLAKILKEVVECFNKHRDYFNADDQVALFGNGFNHDRFYLNQNLPVLRYSTLTPDKEFAKKFLETSNKYNELKREYKELKLEIERALSNLKTYSRIQKEFPEAFELLPKHAGVSQALVVSLSEIRKKI